MISLVRYKTSNSRSPSFRDAFLHTNRRFSISVQLALNRTQHFGPFLFLAFKKKKMTSIQIFALLNSLRVVSILSRPSLLWWRQSAFVQQRGEGIKKQKRDVPWRTNRFNRLRWTRKTIPKWNRPLVLNRCKGSRLYTASLLFCSVLSPYINFFLSFEPYGLECSNRTGFIFWFFWG